MWPLIFLGGGLGSLRMLALGSPALPALGRCAPPTPTMLVALSG